MRMKMVHKAFLSLAVISLLYSTMAIAGLEYRVISTRELHSMVVDNAYKIEGGRERTFIIIDARGEAEYKKAHIFSAVNIPENNFEDYLELLPRNKTVELVVYGNGKDSDTSATWADKAAAHGYRNIAVYSDGFSAWKNQKMPVAPFDVGHR